MSTWADGGGRVQSSRRLGVCPRGDGCGKGDGPKDRALSGIGVGKLKAGEVIPVESVIEAGFGRIAGRRGEILFPDIILGN